MTRIQAKGSEIKHYGRFVKFAAITVHSCLPNERWAEDWIGRIVLRFEWQTGPAQHAIALSREDARELMEALGKELETE